MPRWALAAALATSVLAAHGLGIQAPFQFDDLHQVAGNPAFRDPGAFPRFFLDPWIGSTTGHAFFYRPVLFATFLADGLMGGGGAPVTNHRCCHFRNPKSDLRNVGRTETVLLGYIQYTVDGCVAEAAVIIEFEKLTLDFPVLPQCAEWLGANRTPVKNGVRSREASLSQERRCYTDHG